MGAQTAPAIAARKASRAGEPLVMVTAYDAPAARQAPEDRRPVGHGVEGATRPLPGRARAG
ncbi:MAG TPA: hypothetical protein VFW63_10140, partial [Acidimicrobiales bacterium]|nr:hypothetical protein [Acidimicrobiales bacterium]